MTAQRDPVNNFSNLSFVLFFFFFFFFFLWLSPGFGFLSKSPDSELKSHALPSSRIPRPLIWTTDLKAVHLSTHLARIELLPTAGESSTLRRRWLAFAEAGSRSPLQVSSLRPRPWCRVANSAVDLPSPFHRCFAELKNNKKKNREGERKKLTGWRWPEAADLETLAFSSDSSSNRVRKHEPRLVRARTTLRTLEEYDTRRLLSRK